MRRDARAHAEPHRSETEQRVQLILREASDAHVATHEMRERVERIVGAEHHVRRRDREVGDGIALDHVAEVHDAAHVQVVAARDAAADENVVVVEIVVDRSARKLGSDGLT